MGATSKLAYISAEEASVTLVVQVSLHRCGRASPPAAPRARQSASGRQLRVGDSQTNRETDAHHHRVKPPLKRLWLKELTHATRAYYV